MKKALIASIALACVATTTFAAEVKISGWGRGIFSPANTTQDSTSAVTGVDADGNDIYADSTIGTSSNTSWGGVPRVGFGIDGISEFVGFHVDFAADAAFDGGDKTLGINDQAKIWVKPVKNVTLQIGKIQEDTLRGQMATYGAWNWLRIGSLDQEQAIFGRLDLAQGVSANITPVEGLVILAGAECDNEEAIDTYYEGQLAVGYTIANVGQVRAQWIGDGNDPVFNAAFRFTAVKNLYADVGYAMNIDTDAANANEAPLNMIRGYVKYTMDKLNIHVLGRYDMYDYTDSNAVMTIGGGIDYAVMENVTLEVEARAETVSSADDAIGMGGLVGISKGLGNGKIGVGVEAASKIGLAGISKGSDEDLSWAIPVTYEFWF